MNVLKREQIALLKSCLREGAGVRAVARQIGINRGTASRYRRQWIDEELQRAYDAMWDGEPELCDTITAPLPEKEVREMLDAWLDDQDDGPKSKWY